DWKPQKWRPSYSSASARRMPAPAASRRRPPSRRQLRAETLRFRFLLLVAFVQHFLQDLARSVGVAHFLIRLGEIELGRGVVPLPVEHGRRPIVECLTIRIERQVELVEFEPARRMPERSGSNRRLLRLRLD